jgi:hypothetical protein
MRSKGGVPYNLYVIELSPEVLGDVRFRAKNPVCRADKPCVYVGQTALTPPERFRQHADGHKSNRYATCTVCGCVPGWSPTAGRS